MKSKPPVRPWAALTVSLLLTLLLGFVPTSFWPASAAAAPAASGPATVQSGRVTSALLGADMPYLVYLPPGYQTTGRRYPVLYMLHGMGGDYREWADQGLFTDAERLMTTGAIAPFIIVLPHGDQSYWINWANGGPRYADYLVDEVVPHIDASYRTVPGPAGRAIGGLSMGATGALQLAFNRPDVFGIVGGHSPSLRTEDTALAFMGMGSVFASQDPITLAATSDGPRRLKIWIDVGESDEWRWRVDLLHERLEQRGIPHIYRVLPGGHEREYWVAWTPLYLQFYGEAFGPL